MIQTTIQNSCAVDGYKKSRDVCLTAQCSELQPECVILQDLSPKQPQSCGGCYTVCPFSKRNMQKKKKSEWKKERKGKETRSNYTQRWPPGGRVARAGPVFCAPRCASDFAGCSGRPCLGFLVLFVALTTVETPLPGPSPGEKSRPSKDQVCGLVLTPGKPRHVEDLTCGRYPDPSVAGGPALGCAEHGKDKERGMRPRPTQGSAAGVPPTPAASVLPRPTARVCAGHRTKLPTEETKRCPSTLPARSPRTGTCVYKLREEAFDAACAFS